MKEPLADLLDVLQICFTTQTNKPINLLQFILEEFMRLKTNNPKASLKNLGEEEKLRLQRQALGLLTDSQPKYMDPLLTIYQLNSLEKPLLIEHVSFLHDCSYYKEVRGVIISYYKRIYSFGFDNMIVDHCFILVIETDNIFAFNGHFLRDKLYNKYL